LGPGENETEIPLGQASGKQLGRRDRDHGRVLGVECGMPCSSKYIVITIPKNRLTVGTSSIVTIDPVAPRRSAPRAMLVRRASYARSVAKKFSEVRRALRAEGWVKVRQAGSHQTWERPDGTQALTVAGKDSDTVPAGTLAAIRRTTGLEHLR
jgi:predicted RNA binding protein YcfA (HicA-like mRNA interferase family)